MPAFIPPQQMPYAQFAPQFQQFQAMPFQYVQQGLQFMPSPSTPTQVHPKRKKKKPSQNQQPGQAPQQFPMQPMMPYMAPAQAPLASSVMAAPPVVPSSTQMAMMTHVPAGDAQVLSSTAVP
jgi:hypothetical protein